MQQSQHRSQCWKHCTKSSTEMLSRAASESLAALDIMLPVNINQFNLMENSRCVHKTIKVTRYLCVKRSHLSVFKYGYMFQSVKAITRVPLQDF
jgi:hypothetical protein